MVAQSVEKMDSNSVGVWAEWKADWQVVPKAATWDGMLVVLKAARTVATKVDKLD
jgi:hypothetical protein